MLLYCIEKKRSIKIPCPLCKEKLSINQDLRVDSYLDSILKLIVLNRLFIDQPMELVKQIMASPPQATRAHKIVLMSIIGSNGNLAQVRRLLNAYIPRLHIQILAAPPAHLEPNSACVRVRNRGILSYSLL